MPWTLYRYILFEVLKLLFLSAGVLVLVISFAAAIKPLSDGQVEAASLIKFIVYSGPTMLGFILPFAGAFATTLVFLRLASDNEIIACSAGGVSYFTILLPIFVLGLVMALGLFGLSNFVIPDFYRRASRAVESDLMTMMIHQLNQNRAFVTDEAVLFADRADEESITPELRRAIDSPFVPSKLIRLKGVAIGFLDDHGQVRNDLTADLANLLLYHHENRSWVTVHLEQVVEYDAVRGRLVSIDEVDLPPMQLPTPFREKPKFLSLPQLRRLYVHPDRFDRIDELKNQLARSAAAERLRRLLQFDLDPTGSSRGVLLQDSYRGEVYQVQGPELVRRQDDLVLESVADSPVTVIYGIDPPTRIEARSARVSIEQSVGDVAPRVLVVLNRARVFEGDSVEPLTEHEQLLLRRLVWPSFAFDMFADRSVFEWLSTESMAPFIKSKAVLRVREMLERELIELGHKIKARLHERAASAIACPLLLVLGALLSMRFKDQMPLAIYFWSFLLAIVTLIFIYTGANMAGGLDYTLSVGLGVLWSGNVVLAIVVGTVYCKLARN